MRLRRRHRRGTGLGSARGRFEARAARARRRPLLLATWVTLAVAMAGGLIWVGWFSGLLTATTVRIEGATGAEAKLVRDVARVPLGGPLMRVDAGAVAARLQAGRAWTDIRVGRRLPHSVVIEVTPREPVLAMRNLEGQLELVDRGGIAYRTVATAPKGVPVVTATATTVSPAGLTAALRAVDALPPAVRSTVSALVVGSADQVQFTVTGRTGRRTVLWGSAGDEPVKARLVQILLDKAGGTVIDVSVPTAPVTR